MYTLLSSTVKVSDLHPELKSIPLIEEDGCEMFVVPNGFTWTYKEEIVKIIKVTNYEPGKEVPMFIFVTDKNEYVFPLNSWFNLNELTVEGPEHYMPSVPERTLKWHKFFEDCPVEN
jgi:hypothetical protein